MGNDNVDHQRNALTHTRSSFAFPSSVLAHGHNYRDGITRVLHVKELMQRQATLHALLTWFSVTKQSSIHETLEICECAVSINQVKSTLVLSSVIALKTGARLGQSLQRGATSDFLDFIVIIW